MFKAMGLFLSKGHANLTSRPSQMLSEKPSPEHANYSSLEETNPFIPFWVKVDTTGIMRIRELFCRKHNLQAFTLRHLHLGLGLLFVCKDCGTTFKVTRDNFVRKFSE